MAQLLVRDVDEKLKEKLKERARKNGRSLVSEVRETLRESVADESAATEPGSADQPEPGFWHGYGQGPRDHGFTADDIRAMDGMMGRRPSSAFVDELDESVRRYWEERAEHNGRSVVLEVQRHLTEQARFPRTGPGLASDIASIFRDSSVEPGDFREISLNDWRVADVDHE